MSRDSPVRPKSFLTLSTDKSIIEVNTNQQKSSHLLHPHTDKYTHTPDTHTQFGGSTMQNLGLEWLNYIHEARNPYCLGPNFAQNKYPGGHFCSK